MGTICDYQSLYCDGESRTTPIKGNFVRKEETEAMRRDIERQFNRKEFLDLLQDHKSSWIPDSRGGEPNCRKEGQ